MKMKINMVNYEGIFSSKEKRYLRLLEDTDDFWHLVVTARKRVGIPSRGFSPKQITNNEEYEQLAHNILGGNSGIELIRNAMMIRHIYGIPKYWDYTFASIILMNIAVPPLKSNFPKFEIHYSCHLDNLRKELSTKITRQVQMDTNKITITIRENMSIKDLKNYIDKNQAVLNKYLLFLPTNPNKMDRLGKQKNLSIKKEIRNYKKNGLSYSQIGNKLFKKYGDKISFELDKDQLATYLKRYETFLRSLIKSTTIHDIFCGLD